MFKLFKSKSLLSAENIDFQITTYKWLLKNFGGKCFFDDTQLILPTEHFFPTEVENEEAAAIETFNAVKKHAGMEDWQCKLVKQEQDVNPKIAPTLLVQNTLNNPLGTFEMKENKEIIISYNPDIVRDPTQLVATYAHELAHYLTASGTEPPPGGWENWEFATDIAAVFLGFGIFMANSAFSFQQYTDFDAQGWQYSRNGYLSEIEYIFALAIFLQLKGIAQKSALPYLKPNLKKLLKKSISQIKDSSIIEQLLLVEYEPQPDNDNVSN